MDDSSITTDIGREFCRGLERNGLPLNFRGFFLRGISVPL